MIIYILSYGIVDVVDFLKVLLPFYLVCLDGETSCPLEIFQNETRSPLGIVLRKWYIFTPY